MSVTYKIWQNIIDVNFLPDHSENLFIGAKQICFTKSSPFLKMFNVEIA